MMLTPDVVRFSRTSTAVLTIASVISAAGFFWPFFYSGESLPKTQIFFWFAVTIAFVLVIIQISNSSLDAKSIAL
jgi:energy-coupling factor transport system substrate-specific component